MLPLANTSLPRLLDLVTTPSKTIFTFLLNNSLFRVKLGYDPANNQYFAVKIIKHSHPSLNLKTLKKEIEILAALKHPNIVNLIEFQENADYVKKNGQSYKAVAIVMELVPGGELFEYVADSGRFSEETARTYFRILIESKILSCLL